MEVLAKGREGKGEHEGKAITKKARKEGCVSEGKERERTEK